MGVVLVTGVAGSGKTTVGAALAAALGWDFIEGDTLHPPENVAKMARGEALDDEDRGPWLAALRREVEDRLAREAPAVVSASLLKAAYRRQVHAGDPRVLLVFLDLTPELARRRLEERTGHFFAPELAASQFRALERPHDALVLSAAAPAPELVRRVVTALEPEGEADDGAPPF